jgi:hypothetical protein
MTMIDQLRERAERLRPSFANLRAAVATRPAVSMPRPETSRYTARMRRGRSMPA